MPQLHAGNGKYHFGRPYSPKKTAEGIVAQVLNPLAPFYQDEHRRIALDTISWGEYLHAFVHGSRNPITQCNIPKNLKLTYGDIELIGFVFGAAEFRASLLETVRDHMDRGRDEISETGRNGSLTTQLYYPHFCEPDEPC